VCVVFWFRFYSILFYFILLFYLCRKGRLETAEWLLSVHDNLDFVNDYGCDTSHWVAMSGNVATARWLVSKVWANKKVKNQIKKKTRHEREHRQDAFIRLSMYSVYHMYVIHTC